MSLHNLIGQIQWQMQYMNTQLCFTLSTTKFSWMMMTLAGLQRMTWLKPEGHFYTSDTSCRNFRKKKLSLTLGYDGNLTVSEDNE
jgi:hypothetical protein